jgi:hypothetical protein
LRADCSSIPVDDQRNVIAVIIIGTKKVNIKIFCIESNVSNISFANHSLL